MKYFCLVLVAAGLLSAQVQDILGTRIRAHTKFLSSDLLEGRGVGSRGGDLAAEYLATQLALAGARPAGPNGTWFQPVPLTGAETKPAEAKLSIQSKGNTLDLTWADQFVGVTQRQRAEADFDAEAIFVGHGISAPEFDWDDFKGVDVAGKVVILFTNEPPSDNDRFFGGSALTYYGRWTYKYEEATRRGALACLIVHTTPTASYGWDVVRSSWGKEDAQVRLATGAKGLAFAGWISQSAGEKLFAMSGHSLDEMLKLADTRSFKPMPLSMHIRGHVPAKLREINSQNVVGIIPGSDPEHEAEAVVFSAHWDHLGVGTPVNGDAIYNGAVDNATGCAMVLEMARAWAALPQKPRRSAIFLFVTAEEAGLRGSEYYALHPAVPAEKTALNLNFDAFEPYGVTSDIGLTGAEKTTVWPTVQDVAKRFQFEIKPDPRPEQGSYFRSDHFSMAKAKIPAFSVHGGNEFLGQPAGFGDKMFAEFNERHYHQPSDEYQESWNFSGLEKIARFGFTLGMEVANQPTLPGRMK